MKKTFAKAGQWTAEKTGQAKKTQLDEGFVELEKQTEDVESMVKSVTGKTEEFLQPNPNTRTKLKVTGGSKGYPQPESELASAV